MKKTLSTIMACLAILASYAQTTASKSVVQKVNSETILKPQKGFSAELNVNPFKGELSLNNSLNQIKLRYFVSPQFALRVGFNASRKDSLFESRNPYGTNASNFKDDRKSTSLGLNLGFEKHFKGTRRLSPYLAVDLSLSNKSSEHEVTSGQVVNKLKGAWYTSQPVYVFNPATGSYQLQYIPSQPSAEKAYFAYGLNLASGFDFYMAKNFFLGYEFNFGYQKKNYKEIKITQTGSNNPPANNTVTETKNTRSSFGPNLMNGIRIGYIF